MEIEMSALYSSTKAEILKQNMYCSKHRVKSEGRAVLQESVQALAVNKAEPRALLLTQFHKD